MKIVISCNILKNYDIQHDIFWEKAAFIKLAFESGKNALELLMAAVMAKIKSETPEAIG